MIRAGDPGDAGDYPCVLYATKQPFAGVVFRPLRQDLGEYPGYRFLITQLLPWFILARGCQDKVALHAALKPDGSCLVPLVDLDALAEFREEVRLANLAAA